MFRKTRVQIHTRPPLSASVCAKRGSKLGCAREKQKSRGVKYSETPRTRRRHGPFLRELRTNVAHTCTCYT